MTSNVLHFSFPSRFNPSLNSFISIILSLFSNPKRITQKREKKHEIRAPDATGGSEVRKTWKTNKTDIYGFGGIFGKNVLHLFYTCNECFTLMDVCEGKRIKSSKNVIITKKGIMFSVAIIRDRRKVAGADKPGSLDVRITIDRKSHYISTGIRVLGKHWRGAVVARPDADALNSRLGIIVRRVNEKINESLEQSKPIDVEAIKAYVYSGTVPSTQKDKDCMIEWFKDNVPLLNISEGTRKRYWLLCDRLNDFGKLRSWSDLSVEAIYEWDSWLHHTVKAQVRKDEEDRKGCDSTIYNYHKSLKALLHRAVDFGLIESSPYAKLQGKFSRGDNESVEYLSEDQMQVILGTHPVRGSQMEAARDLFVFQMFTGLAYSDTQAFNIADYRKDGDVWVANGRRIKTGVPYVSVLLPPVIDVLERHGWQTPKICNQKYNSLLKTLGTVIGIEHLHTHLARHTFATYMLSNNVKVENLMRMLGHKNINQTMRYAKVLAKDVQSDFEMIGSKLSLQKTIITKTKRL